MHARFLPNPWAACRPIMARNIETLAPAIARAILASNGHRLSAEQHKSLLADVANTSKPTDLVDNLTSLGNLSALNQEWERFGLVTTERDIPAMIVQIKASLATLRAAKAAADAAAAAAPKPQPTK